MSTIKISTTYTIVCDKCKSSVDVKKEGIPTAGWLNNNKTTELKGWRICKDFCSSLSTEKYFTQIISKITCPKCVEEDRQMRMKSDDIIERANAGYYNENPDKFVSDVYKEYNLSDKHPKIKKFWKLVSDKDSYSEKLCYINEIIELFN